MANQTAILLFLEIWRQEWIRPDANRPHVLRALTDDAIGPAVLAILKMPEKAWTVDSLASECQISRSGFAERFRELVNTTPMDFVLETRLQRAAKYLSDEQFSLKEIAARVGYQSLSAFIAAFKRLWGQTPYEYRTACISQTRRGGEEHCLDS